jgi:EmrB/QacA subfamily drug resistance transporter
MTEDQPRTSGERSSTRGDSVLDRIDPVRFGAPITSLRQLFILLGTIMLGMLTAAVGQTVIGTAAPRIIADLDGVEHYAWIFTAYLLASTISVPIYGKLSDTYGRRPFFLGGLAVFMLGSILCGLAQDMTQLIIFRAIQGLGAGAIIPIAIALVGDIFPPSERGKWQGLMFATFGLATVVGPTLGGWLTDSFGWRWIFYINVPIGIVAILAASTTLPKKAVGERRKIDVLGAVLLAMTAVPLLLALSWAGTQYEWGSTPIIALFTVAVVGLIVFLIVEMRVENPIINPRFFLNRIYSISMLGAFLTALGMFSTVMYMPLFLQGVLGVSATMSGMLVTPMMLGFVLSSILGGQLLSRVGRYKYLAVGGFAVAASGMMLLASMDAGTSTGVVVRNVVITGLGVGVMLQLFTIVAQNAFSIRDLGAVTSNVQFFKQIGGALGVAAMGSVLLNRFQGAFRVRLTDDVIQQVGPERIAEFENPLSLLGAGEGVGATEGGLAAQIPEPLVAVVRESLAIAVTDLYVVGAAIMLVGLAATLFLPEIPLRTTNRDVAESPAETTPERQAAGARAAPREMPSPAVSRRGVDAD